MYLRTGLVLLLTVIIYSCGSEEKKEDKSKSFPAGAHYFSVSQFINDQYKLYMGTPILITQVTTINGKADSVVAPIYETNFTPVFRAAREADIYDRKFLGRYSFNFVQDSMSGTRGFIYEALEDDLDTRMISVNLDNSIYDNIVSFYLHWRKKTGSSQLSKWFYYVPARYLRYIEEEPTRDGEARNLKVEFFWPVAEES